MGGYDRHGAISAFSGEEFRTEGLKKVRENLDQLLRSGWPADAEVPAGEGDALRYGGQFLEVLFYKFDPMEETGGVGDLDGETRAGV